MLVPVILPSLRGHKIEPIQTPDRSQNHDRRNNVERIGGKEKNIVLLFVQSITSKVSICVDKSIVGRVRMGRIVLK